MGHTCTCCGITLAEDDEIFVCDDCGNVVCGVCSSESWELRGELPEIECKDCWEDKQ